jgi:hypothetical protein
MQRTLAIVLVLFSFYVEEINAQSKKERILLLTNQIDSLNSVLKNDRILLNLELNSSKSHADSLEKALFNAKAYISEIEINLNQIKEDFQRNEEKIKIQRDSLSNLKSELASLTWKYDSMFQKINTETKITADQLGLPFIGTKDIYEFWLVGFGGGFNIFYSVRIDEQKDVWLLKNVYHHSDSDGNEWDEKTEFYLGKYSSIIKGVGEFDKNEYYKISSEKFYIVDSMGKELKLSGCCNQHVIAETGKTYFCNCESEFIKDSEYNKE